jgi:predicted RecB family endonuclease
MNLTLEALQILDAIARKGSFAAAAAALDKVPSAITYSIRKLEEDLDVFVRPAGTQSKTDQRWRRVVNSGQKLIACGAGS